MSGEAGDAAGRLIELTERPARTAAEEHELADLQEAFGDDEAGRTRRKARMKGGAG